MPPVSQRHIPDQFIGFCLPLANGHGFHASTLGCCGGGASCTWCGGKWFVVRKPYKNKHANKPNKYNDNNNKRDNRQWVTFMTAHGWLLEAKYICTYIWLRLWLTWPPSPSPHTANRTDRTAAAFSLGPVCNRISLQCGYVEPDSIACQRRDNTR